MDDYNGLTYELGTKIRIQSPKFSMLDNLLQGYQNYEKAQKNLHSMLYPSKSSRQTAFEVMF